MQGTWGGHAGETDAPPRTTPVRPEAQVSCLGHCTGTRAYACVRACVRGHCGLFVRMDAEFPITVGHLLTRVAGATSHCVARFAGACRGLPASDGAGAQ